MEVRRADESDRLQVIALLRDFHTAAGLTFPFQPVYAEMLFKSHLAAGLVLLIGKPAQGVLMAMAFEHPFGAGRWAKETLWYVDPSARGRGASRMLDAYETWAREQRCSTIGMVSLAGNDVSRLYTRRGYAAAETHFAKALN